MKEISNINLTHMANGAHYTYVSDFLARAEADQAVKNKAAAYLAPFKAAVEQEDANLKLSRKDMLSDEIAKADAERDSLYIGYKNAVQGFLKVSVESMAQAARVLSQHVKDYAIDTKAQLDRETGMLTNLIADLEGKYKPQVEALSLTAYVTNLKAANQRVATLMGTRDDNSAGTVVGALRASRRATDEAYRLLVRMVNSLAMVFGDADYADFIDRTNARIVRYKREVLGQKATPDGTEGTGGQAPDSGEGGNTGGNQGGSGETGGDQGGTGGNQGGSTGGDIGGDDLA
ncbi:MAG: DUF6261 family protein [Bacteroidaceae bacterium]